MNRLSPFGLMHTFFGGLEVSVAYGAICSLALFAVGDETPHSRSC